MASEIKSGMIGRIDAKGFASVSSALWDHADLSSVVGRLAPCRRYDVSDATADGSFDRITTIAARIFDVPIAVVTIVDEGCAWFKSRLGELDIAQLPIEAQFWASPIRHAKRHAVDQSSTGPIIRENSALRRKSRIRFHASAPLRTRDGFNLGKLCILDDEPRRLTRSETLILESLAEMVVDELELRLSTRRTVASERAQREYAAKRAEETARLYYRQRDAAIVLQDALLPKAFPKHERVRFNGVYIAAASDAFVGGDWYDVLAIDDSRICVSIGDVEGHSLESAVVMGTVKQSIRTAAREFGNPRELLSRLNAMLCDEDYDRIVTTFLGFLEPQTGRLTYANAGHPPPIVRHRDGTVTMFDTGGDPLGLERSSHRVDKTVALDPGSLLVLYTDGLTEARRNVLDGERLVCEAVRSDAIVRADNPAEALRQAVIPNGSHDDVAILTVMLM